MTDTFDFEHDDQQFRATIEPDFDMDAPWDNEDGHGPVSAWERRAKRPGELILAGDRTDCPRLFYDYQAACDIARRDGWGFLPEPVRIERRERGGMTGAALPTYRCGDYSVVSDCPNEAHATLYRLHRESMTAKEYAAQAARRDFERLRAWCSGDWCYLGVIVAPICGCCGEVNESMAESLWGIESDRESYIEEVAQELAEQVIDNQAQAA